jgi:hypothetical protein
MSFLAKASTAVGRLEPLPAPLTLVLLYAKAFPPETHSSFRELRVRSPLGNGRHQGRFHRLEPSAAGLPGRPLDEVEMSPSSIWPGFFVFDARALNGLEETS